MHPIETSQLKNGLKLAAVSVRGTSFVDVTVAVRVGSRYEPALQNGMSHFLEHMIFRGSKNYPSSFFLNHALESLGDGLEGGTTREFTLYTIQVPPDHLTQTLTILGDLFHEPLLQDVETEKEIIFEEILEELDEHGEECDLENLSRKLIFGEHPLARPVLGRSATLANVSRDDLMAHFKEFYQPDNMVIVATGSVDAKRFFKTASTVFGSLEQHTPDEAPFLSDSESPDVGTQFASVSPLVFDAEKLELPSGEVGPYVQFRPKSASQLDVLLSFLAEGERSPNYVAQMALERALDDGLSSRLQRSLCERKGLLYDIGAAIDSYTDIGVVDFSFKIVEEKARVALREIFRELRNLKLTEIDPQELAKIKGRLHREVLSFFENSRALSCRIAEVLLLGLKTPLKFDEWEKRIDALTAREIQEAARRIFVPERLVAVVEGHVPEIDQGDITQIFEVGLTKGF